MKKQLLILLLLCFSVAIYADKKEEYYNQAKKEMSQGQYRPALEHLNLLVEINQNSTNYRDVDQMIRKCNLEIDLEEKYKDAKKQMEQKNYAQARAKLKGIKDKRSHYRDVDKLIAKCDDEIHKAELAQRKKDEDRKRKEEEARLNQDQANTNSQDGNAQTNTGGGTTITIVEPAPCQGYMCLYDDYYDAIDSDWRLQWFTVDFHGGSTVGDNISVLAFRWKPVEASLLNFNFDYVRAGGFSLNWEPIVRGYLPVTHDGKWALYAGMGAHVSLYGGFHRFLCELGAEINWNEKYSSRMFMKYNGGFAVGMSFSMGKWL